MPDTPAIAVRSDDLTDLVQRLRQVENGKELIKQLRRDTRKAMQPAVPAIRSAVRRTPSKGETARRPGRTSLRRSTAKATRLQVKLNTKMAGVTLRVDPKKMPPGQHNLPAYLNGAPPFTPWRHPRFGDWDQPQQQHAHPYFDDIVRRYRPAGVQAIEGSMESMRKAIEE